MKRSRLAIGLVMAAVALLGYYGSREVNPVTGETQHIALSQEQELATLVGMVSWAPWPWFTSTPWGVPWRPLCSSSS